MKKCNSFILLIFFLFIFGSLSPVFAGGRRDPVFGDADDYIKQKAYADAIIELIRITRDDHLQFDNAQKRIRNILRSSNRYTEVAAELLNLIETDPSNSERIFQLSEDLDKLGEARTEQARLFITQIQEVARYMVFRNQLENVLVEGRRLIDAGNYYGAYELYLRGFSIYQNAFTASNYSYPVKVAVSDTQQAIVATAAPFQEMSTEIAAVAEQINTLLNSTASPATQLYSTASYINQNNNLFTSLVRLKERLWTLRDQYRDYGLIDNRSEGRYYITFGNLLINGRPDEGIREGLLGALDGLWLSAAKPAWELVRNQSENQFARAFDLLKANNTTEAQRIITQTGSSLSSMADFVPSENSFRADDETAGYNIFGNLTGETNASSQLFYASMLRALSSLSQTTNYAEAAAQSANQAAVLATVNDFRSRRITAETAVSSELNIRNGLLNLQTRIQDLINNTEQNIAAVSPFEFTISGGDKSVNYFRQILQYAKTLDSSVFSFILASAQRQYTIENENYARDYPGRQNIYDTALSLANGFEKTMPEGESYISHDPQRAAELLDELTAQLSRNIEDGRALLNRYEIEDGSIQNTEEIETLRLWASTQLARYEDLRTRGLSLLQNSREAVARAEALWSEGVALFNETVNVLATENFDRARSNLEEADALYEAALAIQDSDAMRQSWADQHDTLTAEIKRQERLKAEREVLALITSAKIDFYAENFETSEQYLITAQNVFARVSDEDHPDIQHWLTIVRNALSLRSGRTIPFTAPLYPEMSQLLSDASTNFNDGLSLMQKGKREEALNNFAEARAKTQMVKLLFPINYTAGILELKMEQIEDAQSFNVSFQTRLSRAVAGTKTGDLQAYVELQNLAEINPNYRGMRDIVIQAEVDMGLRPPPPDQVAIARSMELTRAAQNLIAGGVRSNLEIARSQLLEALRVNPANTTAQSELDRAERLMGLAAQSEREAKVEPEYQDAVRELLAGNTLIAYSIVKRVLAKPEHKNSGRFLELLQRIESVL